MLRITAHKANAKRQPEEHYYILFYHQDSQKINVTARKTQREDYPVKRRKPESFCEDVNPGDEHCNLSVIHEQSCQKLTVSKEQRNNPSCEIRHSDKWYRENREQWLAYVILSVIYVNERVSF